MADMNSILNSYTGALALLALVVLMGGFIALLVISLRQKKRLDMLEEKQEQSARETLRYDSYLQMSEMQSQRITQDQALRLQTLSQQLDGISGHADRDMLIGWLDGFEKKPRMVFVNHGQDTVCDEFAQTVTERLGIKAVAPYNGAEYDLLSGTALIQGNTKRIEKLKQQHSQQNKKESPAFRELLAAGRWLLSILEKYRDDASADLKKMTKQIIALCEKWDK